MYQDFVRGDASASFNSRDRRTREGLRTPSQIWTFSRPETASMNNKNNKNPPFLFFCFVLLAGGSRAAHQTLMHATLHAHRAQDLGILYHCMMPKEAMLECKSS